MRTLAVLMMLSLAAPVAAQTCTPAYGWGQTYWSNEAGNLTTDANASTAHAFMPGAVPAGTVWQMRTLSVSTDDGRRMEYFIEHLVNVPPYGTAGHYHRIAGGWGEGTPALDVAPADASALVMLPGERLAVRSNPPNNTPMQGLGMLLLYSYFSYPEACLPRALGMEAPASGSSAAALDFSALGAAAQDAADKLGALAQSVP